MTALTPSPVAITGSDHGCPRCGQAWIELSRPPCPRCLMPFDTKADGTRMLAGSRTEDVDICARCAEHEALLDVRDEELPGPAAWPLHPNKILRDLADGFGDREWTQMEGRRLLAEREADPGA